MKNRICMSLDTDLIGKIDSVRGFIGRSAFVNAVLDQKVEQIRNEGGVVGQI